MKAEDLIFALDIGTRSVIGVVCKKNGDIYEILDAEETKHTNRAVVDGQIEDIQNTAKIVSGIKERLESRLDVSLERVYTAAAGRVLKTARVTFEKDLDDHRPVQEKDIVELEAAGVQKAYQQIKSELSDEDTMDFCNVGHTVVEYKLDGYSFSTLLGHRGKKAAVELIATFLPNGVVESIYSTASVSKLAVSGMTLEPIAAMNAVVPKELRLLNIALVDVGAGTSDIAVSDKGSIRGYTMATIAGDEITESIMQQLLVDFDTAEKIKFDLSSQKENIEYDDILGIDHSVSRSEALSLTENITRELAHRIAAGIMEINDSAPKAVFMVGGGSRTEGLCKMVAEELSIEENKVAVGGNNYMKRLIKADDKYLSAEYATPVGIAVTAVGAEGSGGMTITLNGSKISLLGGNMTVMEALRLGGYQYGQIMGRSGKSLIYNLNGERKIQRGSFASLSEVFVNDKLAGLSDVLSAGDKVEFTPACDGSDASLTVEEAYSQWEEIPVKFLDEDVICGSRGFINGKAVSKDSPISSLDDVSVKDVSTVRKILEESGIDLKAQDLTLNNKPLADLDAKLSINDIIGLTQEISENPLPAASNAAEEEVSTLPITLNGQKILLPLSQENEYQLFSLLNYVDMDPQNPKGDVIILRNNETATYTDQIFPGDNIEIHWNIPSKSDIM